MIANSDKHTHALWLFISTIVLLFASGIAQAQAGKHASLPLTSLSAEQTIQPDELVNALQSKNAPLVLNVGPRMLYMQAHIRGAEYIGAGSDPAAMNDLRARVKLLPRNKFIVIYCGCCPWSHCPNVLPAFNVLRAMQFKNVKALYIANNIGTDWVYKGYPTTQSR